MDEHKEEHEKREHSHEPEGGSHNEEHKEEHSHKEHEAHHEEQKEEHAGRHQESRKEDQDKQEKEEEKQPAEKRELRDGRISMLIFSLAGIGMGFLSSYLKSSMVSNWVTVFAGFIILGILAFGISKLYKKKPKAFLGEMFVYLLIWLVTWIFLFNM
jgi:cation transport ATPase